MQIDQAVPGVSAQQKQTWINQRDGAVDEAHGLAAALLAQLKAYKDHHPG
jgi:hypothetical protein